MQSMLSPGLETGTENDNGHRVGSQSIGRSMEEERMDSNRPIKLSGPGLGRWFSVQVLAVEV